MKDPIGYLYRTALNRQRSKRRMLQRAAKCLVGGANDGVPSQLRMSAMRWPVPWHM